MEEVALTGEGKEETDPWGFEIEGTRQRSEQQRGAVEAVSCFQSKRKTHFGKKRLRG